MEIRIVVEKKYAVSLLIGMVLILGAVFVSGFGSGGPPSFVGHSPDELNITGLEAQLSCSTLTGSSGLCDGNDAQTYALADRATITTSGGTNTSSCCGGGFNIMSGGCQCNGGAVNVTRRAETTECANENGWHCECSAGSVTVIGHCTASP